MNEKSSIFRTSHDNPTTKQTISSKNSSAQSQFLSFSLSLFSYTIHNFEFFNAQQRNTENGEHTRDQLLSWWLIEKFSPRPPLSTLLFADPSSRAARLLFIYRTRRDRGESDFVLRASYTLDTSAHTRGG